MIDGKAFYDEKVGQWVKEINKILKVPYNPCEEKGGGGVMTTNGDFWGLMGTKNRGDSG